MEKESMFIIGTISLTVSIILSRFFPEWPVISFLEGVFTGISVPMNLGFLIKYRIEKNNLNETNSITR
ncbi:MAG: hypothetical protein ACFFCY_14335 [Promethearchaeota archaeon]|jgi:hypothetical protein